MNEVEELWLRAKQQIRQRLAHKLSPEYFPAKPPHEVQDAIIDAVMLAGPRKAEGTWEERQKFLLAEHRRLFDKAIQLLDEEFRRRTG